MTEVAHIPRAEFAGIAGGTFGPFGFSDSFGAAITLDDVTWLKVTRFASATAATGTPLVNGLDYVVAGLPSTVVVNLQAPQTGLLAAERLVLERIQPRRQGLNVLSGGLRDSVATQDTFDSLVQQIQEVDTKLSWVVGAFDPGFRPTLNLGFPASMRWFALNMAFPGVDGVAGQVLKTDGAGALAWSSDNAGSGGGFGSLYQTSAVNPLKLYTAGTELGFYIDQLDDINIPSFVVAPAPASFFALNTLPGSIGPVGKTLIADGVGGFTWGNGATPIQLTPAIPTPLTLTPDGLGNLNLGFSIPALLLLPGFVAPIVPLGWTSQPFFTTFGNVLPAGIGAPGDVLVATGGGNIIWSPPAAVGLPLFFAFNMLPATLGPAGNTLVADGAGGFTWAPAPGGVAGSPTPIAHGVMQTVTLPMALLTANYNLTLTPVCDPLADVHVILVSRTPTSFTYRVYGQPITGLCWQIVGGTP
jgi:hypothetical protein